MLPEYVTDWIAAIDALHACTEGRELTPKERILWEAARVGLAQSLQRYKEETPAAPVASRYLGMG